MNHWLLTELEMRSYLMAAFTGIFLVETSCRVKNSWVTLATRDILLVVNFTTLVMTLVIVFLYRKSC